MAPFIDKSTKKINATFFSDEIICIFFVLFSIKYNLRTFQAVSSLFLFYVQIFLLKMLDRYLFISVKLVLSVAGTILAFFVG